MRTLTLSVALAGLAFAPFTRTAHADRPVELGGFVGGHWFNGSNELRPSR